MSDPLIHLSSAEAERVNLECRYLEALGKLAAVPQENRVCPAHIDEAVRESIKRVNAILGDKQLEDTK